MLTINMLVASDSVIVPMQAQYLSAKGLEQLLSTVSKVKRQINSKLRIEGVLCSVQHITAYRNKNKVRAFYRTFENGFRPLKARCNC